MGIASARCLSAGKEREEGRLLTAARLLLPFTPLPFFFFPFPSSHPKPSSQATDTSTSAVSVGCCEVMLGYHGYARTRAASSCFSVVH